MSQYNNGLDEREYQRLNFAIELTPGVVHSVWVNRGEEMRYEEQGEEPSMVEVGSTDEGHVWLSIRGYDPEDSHVSIEAQDAMQWAWDVFCLACQSNNIEPWEAAALRSYHCSERADDGIVAVDEETPAKPTPGTGEVWLDITTDPEDCR